MVGMVFMTIVISAAAFATIKVFPLLLEIFDLDGCMFILGSGSILGFFFILFVMKETSGQSLDDVGADEKLKTNRFHVARVNSIS